MTQPLRNPSQFDDFSRWINNHSELHSIRDAIVVTDIDKVIHKYISHCDGKGTRDIQYMMFLEIKTMGADLQPSQHDVLLMVNDLIRTTAWKHQRDKGRFITGHAQNTRAVYSSRNGIRVQLVCFGVHLLRFDGTSPENSARIEWDRKEITAKQLVSLLRFELHPDTLQKLDPRRHKRQRSSASLFDGSE